MLKAAVNGSVLKDLVESLACVVDECKVNYTADGLKVRAVDPANVCMVVMDLSAAAFDVYDATSSTFAVDLVKLKDVVAGMASDDKAELEVVEGDRKLVIRYASTTYRLSLLDEANARREPKVPSLDLAVQAVMTGDQLKYMVKTGEKIGQYVVFTGGDGSFTAESESDLDSVVVSYHEAFLVSLRGLIKASVALAADYLSDIVKGAGKADQVTVEIGSEAPAWFSYRFAGGNGTMRYLLAPRVESE